MAEFAEKYINPLRNPDQVRSYEDSLKYYRDLKNSLDTAREEGREEGREEEKKEIARLMLSANEPVQKIMAFTGLTQDQVEQLKTETDHPDT